MKAAIFKKYGTPEVITIEDVSKPTINDNQILIKVNYSAVNSGDARIRRADPWLVRLMYGLTSPRKSKRILGVVFAGTIESFGTNVQNVTKGTRVYGLSDNFMGGHSEYTKINSTDPYGIIPDSVTDSEAAAIAFGGTTTIDYLRDIELNNKTVIINGASGSVGTSLLQIATAKGAIVTTITSNKNTELMSQLGAKYTLDYNNQEQMLSINQYHVVIDCINNLSINKLESMVQKDGYILMIAGLVKEILASKIIKKAKVKIGPAVIKTEDYLELNKLFVDNKLKPVITQSYILDDIKKAHVIVDSGHKVGNIVIEIIAK